VRSTDASHVTSFSHGMFEIERFLGATKDGWRRLAMNLPAEGLTAKLTAHESTCLVHQHIKWHVFMRDTRNNVCT
jgi:hypothetical protein